MQANSTFVMKIIVKVENLDDPVTPVVAILDRVPRDHLMLQYGIGHFKVNLCVCCLFLCLAKKPKFPTFQLEKKSANFFKEHNEQKKIFPFCMLYESGMKVICQPFLF